MLGLWLFLHFSESVEMSRFAMAQVCIRVCRVVLREILYSLWGVLVEASTILQ